MYEYTRYSFTQLLECGALFTKEPLPKNGQLYLSDSPDFGTDFNKTNLDLHRPLEL